MKCPYCGAELQENARFCLYCMKSLQDKQTIESPQRKKRLWRMVSIAAAAAVAIAAALFFLLRQEAPAPEAKAESTQWSESGETLAATVEPTHRTVNSELPPIIDPNMFFFSAAQQSKRLEADDLWEPASMWFPDETRAVVPLNLQEADCQVLFLEGGSTIFASVTNLTDDTLADGRRIADCITAAVYDGIADAPSLQDVLPAEQTETSLLALLQLDDPADAGRVTGVARCRLKPVSYGGGQQYLLYELRTRSCEDGIYYDIFLYFGQE